MLTINVRLFAGLKDLIGEREITIDVPAGATVGDLRNRVGQAYPIVQALLPVLVCAVDEEYVDPTHVLREGDTVALIPPVSGGR